VVLAAAAPAGALTLQQVIDDGGFTVDGVTFSDFSVSITGDLAGVLEASDLAVIVESGPGSVGFSLSGPISAADGEIGDILLSFKMSSSTAIDGAILNALNVANGLGAQAAVDEWVRDGNGVVLGLLSTSDTGGPGAPIFEDSLGFAPQLALMITKDILVDSALIGGGPDGSARISLIQQTFLLVPEPGSLLLLGIGLGLLKRARRARPD
jgi:hypothetical protein